MKRDSSPHDLLVAFLLVQNALQRRSDVFFESFGLTDAQFNILNLLATTNGVLDQLSLTERLLVGKSSISIVLSRMAKAGLIKRHAHPEDRRQVVLTLTPRGRNLWTKVFPRYEESVREVFGALARARHKPFVDDLEKLYAALNQGSSFHPQQAVLRTLRETVQEISADSDL